MATVIKEIRRENDKKGWYTLVFNGGDLISGTPVSFRYKGKAETDFLNITGIDASVIGNHDFDFGYDNLTKIITSSNGDMLAANIIGRNSKR